jgi:hypothetical protein
MSHLKQNRAVAFGESGALGQITTCLTSVFGKFRPMV